MRANNKKPATEVHSTSKFDSLLGPPSFLNEEDLQIYTELLARVRALVIPQDIIEDLSVCDAVYHAWQVFQYRQLKPDLQMELAEWRDNDYPNLAFSCVVGNNERLDHLIVLAERRKNAAFRELAIYRVELAEHLRRVLDSSLQALSAPPANELIDKGSTSGASLDDDQDQESLRRISGNERE